MDSFKFQDVISTAVEIFKDNLVFAFIGGSYARGEQRVNSDIDVLIVIKYSDPTAERNYGKYFCDFHQSNSLRYDHIGELFSINILDDLLNFIEGDGNRLNSILNSACYHSDCSNSIIRKGDIVMKFFLDPKIKIVGDLNLLNSYILRAESFFKEYPMLRIQRHKDVDAITGQRKILRNLVVEEILDSPGGVSLERFYGGLSQNLEPFDFERPNNQHLCPLKMKLRCQINFTSQCLIKL